MCMIGDGDEPYRLYNESHHKARKDHRCSECGRTIGKGEGYKRVEALGDRWDTWKTCSHCQIVQTWLMRQCGGFLHSAVEEDTEEHFREYHMLSVGRIAVGMRRKWQRFDGAGPLAIPTIPEVTP